MKPLVIHQTDLFHSHNDPDDHWDMACQYAFAFSGDIELGGVLIDYPPMGFGDPAIQAINQLNYITGLWVPVGVGIPETMKAAGEYKRNSGTNMVLRTLEKSNRPVIIHIVGSCRDIAIAAKLNPELFREKCGGIYLNAGASSPESKPEWNVSLDPYSYSIIFGLECPIYWSPCFEFAPEPPQWQFKMGQYGTFYRFMQYEILPYLSENMQKYFLYALGKVTDNNWLSYLSDPVNKRLLAFFNNKDRSMYSTGGFFNGAGKTVTGTGEIVDTGENPGKTVFAYESVEITCDGNGNVKWKVTDKATNRYIFKINDLENYKQAMTNAMKSLLMKLP